MNLCLLLSKVLGGRKGPSTFTLSGTITGDEVEGATITLTGDASDSTTSAVDGTYSFTGLSNGNYNVEPSLDDYVFSPANIDVTIASADDTDNDFVSSQLWDISGTILGDVADGVTVTLTGDASDSTTSAGGGLYSFTDLVNGSYTVTPTLEDYEFTPTSINVTISDADDTDNDFTSAAMTFPDVVFFKNYDSATLDQAPPGTSTAVGTPLVKAIANDSSGYAPVGFSRCVEIGGNQTARVGYALQFPTNTGVYRSEVIVQADNNTGMGIYSALIVDANDQMWTSYIVSSGAKEYKATVNGVAKTYGTQAVTITNTYWMIIQTEWSFTTNELKCRIVVPGATQDTGWHTKSIGDWDDGAATEVMVTWVNTAAGSKFRLAQIWWGSGTDAFPDGAKQS